MHSILECVRFPQFFRVLSKLETLFPISYEELKCLFRIFNKLGILTNIDLKIQKSVTSKKFNSFRDEFKDAGALERTKSRSQLSFVRQTQPCQEPCWVDIVK